MNPRILALGDGALTLEFGDRIDPALNARVMAARDALAALKLDGISDVVPTYRSLTVHFDPLRLDREILTARLLEAAQAPAKESALATRWRIPVVFGGEYGPDLAEVARATGRSEAAVIEALCASELRVFLIGFLPGFPYLGELPEWLRLPRLATPRAAVPANSLAIAGAQAAVYPWQSPGGWHLLGRTPVRLFDLGDAARPALLAPGDTVRFAPAGRDEFLRLAADVEAGKIGRQEWQAK
ncbi:MAG: 5-oxoprolinase subunit PxpB [Rhodocyclales bacterium]|nr:5-oxoprolinase subunit PxpB [Rhodocyclales bacterium]